MVNEWFFKWHYIGRGPGVEIESFRGKPICYGGIKFDGTAHHVYWDTIQYYLRQKVSQIFDDIEREIKEYPIDVRRDALKEARYIVSGFAGKIRQQAIKKDRILRGNGVDFPEARDFGTWDASTSGDIEQRANALLAIYVPKMQVETRSWRLKLKETYDQHKWWYDLGKTIVAIALVVITLVTAIIKLF
jgi:hypothetical protein